MSDFETIAYGLERSVTGKTIIVQVQQGQDGARLQRKAGALFSAEMAELVARTRAEKEGVPYVGYRVASA